jgi:hypothetical protein
VGVVGQTFCPNGFRGGPVRGPKLLRWTQAGATMWLTRPM